MIEQMPLPLLASIPATPVKPKPIYSYSQIETGECLQKFKYEYIERRPRTMTYSLVAGTILDMVFNAYYRDNLHLTESHDSRMEYARVVIQQEIEDHPEWLALPWSKKPGDVRSSPRAFIGWLFDGGAASLICRPTRGRVETQAKLEFSLKDYGMVGYLDCLELDRNVVVDVKMVASASEVTQIGYALRPQIALYRWLLWKTRKLKTKGVYELLIATKTPRLVAIDDPDEPALLKTLLKKFSSHHRRTTALKGELRNASKCTAYNSPCAHLHDCWPKLSQLMKNQNPET